MSERESIKPIGPYERGETACREYNPRAAEAAARVAAIIQARMPSLRVEHIGSTAVPGCAGKGYIDLLVLYPPGQLEEAKAALYDLGFQRQQSRDPFPESRPMRTGSFDHQGERFLLHAHVIVEGDPEASELLRFRDRLRADPELREAYVARKRRILAEGISDSLDYTTRKGGFIRQVLDEG